MLWIRVNFVFFLDFTVPSNLEASPMSYSSVLLHWESNSINKFGFLHYNVNIKPPSIAGNCTKGSCNVNFLTEVYLVNMKPLTPYIFTVRVVSCVGIGSESRNLTFSITAYSKWFNITMHVLLSVAILY